jgi:hypothetical protein
MKEQETMMDDTESMDGMGREDSVKQQNWYSNARTSAKLDEEIHIVRARNA